MISIGKIFSFEAAHTLPNHEGKCRNLHGHSYRLEVEVTKEVNQETGMVMDFGDLTCIVHKYIIDILDHSNLNTINKNPTAERLLLGMVNVLKNFNNPPHEVKLKRLRLWETEKCYAEWTPDD
jgi:6-pyruvoyltetrahydropterin/6-carboxytetrahydropterin synthase